MAKSRMSKGAEVLNTSPTESQKRPMVNSNPLTKNTPKAALTSNSLVLLTLPYVITDMTKSMREKPINATVKNSSTLFITPPAWRWRDGYIVFCLMTVRRISLLRPQPNPSAGHPYGLASNGIWCRGGSDL